LALITGCEGRLLTDKKPAGQQEPGYELILQASMSPPKVESPVTATPLPTSFPAERPIYGIDAAFSQQPILSRIFMIDPDWVRIVWTITTRYMPEAAFSPEGNRLFVADSYWTQVTRGDQQDVLSIYDAHNGELLVDDISIQKR